MAFVSLERNHDYRMYVHIHKQITKEKILVGDPQSFLANKVEVQEFDNFNENFSRGGKGVGKKVFAVEGERWEWDAMDLQRLEKEQRC